MTAGLRMDANDKLKWVIKNRRTRRAPRRIGVAIERLAGELGDIGRSSAVLAGAVGELVDANFRAHCRVTVLNDGQMVVYVDRSALVSDMRRRWQTTLNNGLAANRRGNGVSSVRFAYGTVGTPIASNEQHGERSDNRSKVHHQ